MKPVITEQSSVQQASSVLSTYCITCSRLKLFISPKIIEKILTISSGSPSFVMLRNEGINKKSISLTWIANWPTSVITGYIKGEDKLIYVDPVIPVEDKLVLAQHLLKHGLIGEIPPKKTNEDTEYSNEFHAKKFVYLAVAHLGMRESDAWNMSMTAFQEAMEAKFPSPKNDIVSQDDYDAAMSYADSVVGLSC